MTYRILHYHNIPYCQILRHPSLTACAQS